MFLDEDKESADEEAGCFDYNIILANQKVADGNFTHAIIHLDNAKRSLSALKELQNKEEMDKQVKDDTQFIVDRIIKSYE